MNALMPVRRFPGKGLVGLRPRRGTRGYTALPMGGGLVMDSSSPSLSEITGQPWYAPDWYYNLTNQASPNQVYLANQDANAAAAKASINPVTGQVVPAAQAYANSTSGAAGAAEQQAYTQSTGSSFADLFNNLLATLSGTGTTVTPPSSSGIPWGTIAIFAALGVGGYVLYKNL